MVLPRDVAGLDHAENDFVDLCLSDSRMLKFAVAFKLLQDNATSFEVLELSQPRFNTHDQERFAHHVVGCLVIHLEYIL